MSEKQHHGHKWMPVVYGSIYGALVEAARKHGYALALHGSLTRDLDLLAVPWTETASSQTELLAELYKIIGWESDGPPWHGEPEQKPHGRTAYVIHTGGGGYMDISIIQPQQAGPAASASSPAAPLSADPASPGAARDTPASAMLPGLTAVSDESAPPPYPTMYPEPPTTNDPQAPYSRHD